MAKLMPTVHCTGMKLTSFLQLIGISFHVGSGCQDIPIYAEAISTARKLFDFAESVGFKLRLLDIGGGFPGDKNTDIAPVWHRENNTTNNIRVVNRIINTLYLEFFYCIDRIDR